MAGRDDDLERAVALGAGDFEREAQDAGLGDETARQDAQENGAPEYPAGTESEPAADTPDLHDPRNRDNWRVENWRVT